MSKAIISEFFQHSPFGKTYGNLVVFFQET